MLFTAAVLALVLRLSMGRLPSTGTGWLVSAGTSRGNARKECRKAEGEDYEQTHTGYIDGTTNFR